MNKQDDGSDSGPGAVAKRSLEAFNSAAETSLEESNSTAEADLKKSNRKAEALFDLIKSPLARKSGKVPFTKNVGSRVDDTSVLPAGFRWLYMVFAYGTFLIGTQYVAGDPDRFSASTFGVFFDLFGGLRVPGALFMLIGVALLFAFHHGRFLIPVLWVAAGNYVFYAVLFTLALFQGGDPPASGIFGYLIMASIPVAFVLTLRQWRRLQGSER